VGMMCFTYAEDPLFRTMFPDTEIEKIWQWSRARKIGKPARMDFVLARMDFVFG